MTDAEKEQQRFCKSRGMECLPAFDNAIVGYAQHTGDLLPLNGLRHPIVGNTSGWYIWGGEIFNVDPDFFEPVCANHLFEKHPEMKQLLGLPPGYRFLLAGDYLDIWFDEALLAV